MHDCFLEKIMINIPMKSPVFKNDKHAKGFFLISVSQLAFHSVSNVLHNLTLESDKYKTRSNSCIIQDVEKSCD